MVENEKDDYLNQLKTDLENSKLIRNGLKLDLS